MARQMQKDSADTVPLRASHERTHQSKTGPASHNAC